MARALSAWAPRGKGAIPRLIGRLTRPWIHHAFVTRHGASIPLVSEAFDVFVAMSRQRNAYDYWVFRIANGMLENAGVLYDVGANVGYISVETANLRRGDGVRVFAFEPLRQLANAIREAARLNRLDNLCVAEAAVGAGSGTLAFSQQRNSFVGAVTPAGGIGTLEVVAVTIDEMVYGEGWPPPDVLKIDVEGYEHQVLSGARRVLAEYRPAVIFEISPGTGRYGFTPKMIMDLLLGMDEYRFYTIKCLPLSPQDIERKIGLQGDILAVPPRRGARLDWLAERFHAGRIDSYWD